MNAEVLNKTTEDAISRESYKIKINSAVLHLTVYLNRRNEILDSIAYDENGKQIYSASTLKSLLSIREQYYI